MIEIYLQGTYECICFFLVGQSLDLSDVTMLDSLKVYCKTKESFGWPDDAHEEIASAPVLGTGAFTTTETELVNSAAPMTSFDKYVSKMQH